MQNIYDNEIFFEGYKKLREKEVNANNLFEIPALFSLLPDLDGKSIIDLGCGFGEHCTKFTKCGASKVLGIDISEKMLEVAKKENCNEKIKFYNMPIENISLYQDKFDVAVSSLAVHYIKDFEKLGRDVYNILNKDGIFVFSQENPINTCFSDGERWTKDEDGNKIYANIKNYNLEGEIESTWFVDGVKKYHRTFSTIINALVKAGFIIEAALEPTASFDIMEKYPQYKDSVHKPDFLLIRARK